MREIVDRGGRSPRRRETAKLLLGVSNRLAMSKTLTEALDTLAELTTQTLGAERGSIFLNDPQPENCTRGLPRESSVVRSGC